MPAFAVETANARYQTLVERGALTRAADFLPEAAGKLFVVTQRDIWELHGARLDPRLRNQAACLFLPPGEPEKRLSNIERLAEQMVAAGADRTSVVVGFGGGIVTDLAGFLAAIFMRGIPVLQIPTTLLAQVDAAIGGKTGVNLEGGKNLLGSFHQPLAVVIDPTVLETLPLREFRAGVFEVIKCAIIRDPDLFHLLETQSRALLAGEAAVVDAAIAAAVRIKAEVVSADERESDLRRILNFGHTVGHAIEAETHYDRFLHGEAVGLGMLAAIRLAELAGYLASGDAERMRSLVNAYGPLPPSNGLSRDNLIRRLGSDKKTRAGNVHFVLPEAIGKVKIVSGLETCTIAQALEDSLAGVA